MVLVKVVPYTDTFNGRVAKWQAVEIRNQSESKIKAFKHRPKELDRGIIPTLVTLSRILGIKLPLWHVFLVHQVRTPRNRIRNLDTSARELRPN